MQQKLLRIYLNDHRAGAEAGLELAKRCLKNNEGTEFAPFLRGLTDEIRDDLQTLEDCLRALEMTSNPAKIRMAWLAEKIGRAKLNGRVRGYSPLSRLLEFEGLALGIEGKRRLWRTLEEHSKSDARLGTDRMRGLIERADRQLAEVEQWRLKAVSLVLTGSD